MKTFAICTTHNDFVIEADDAELALITAEFDFVNSERMLDVVDITDDDEDVDHELLAELRDAWFNDVEHFEFLTGEAV
jgi:hypothetical protein